MATDFLTPLAINAVTSARLGSVSKSWPLVCDALEKFDINTALVQVGLAATIAIETSNFEPIKERRASAERQPVVWKAQERYWASNFMGRGYIQLTWQKNYDAASKAIGVDILTNPDLVMEPEISALVAAWFFKTNGIHTFCNTKNWALVRKAVNGPNYDKDADGYARFLRYCNGLMKGVAE